MFRCAKKKGVVFYHLSTAKEFFFFFCNIEMFSFIKKKTMTYTKK
jgi:hypothetical protein